MSEKRGQKIGYFDTNDAARIRLAIGIILIVLSLSNVVDDSSSMSSGRWSWFYLVVQNHLGRYGWPIVQGVIGVLFIAWSRNKG